MPEENSFTIGVETTQKDYIVLKAIEKPLINILWVGTLLLMIGFSIATHRRYQEFKKQRKKEVDISVKNTQRPKRKKPRKGAVSV